MTAALLDHDVHLVNNVILHATPLSTTLHHLNASDESESDASIECEYEREREQQQKETRLASASGSGSEAFFKPGPLRAGSPWTGTPIRAITPLPRRSRLVPALNGTAKGNMDTVARSVSAPAVGLVGGPSKGFMSSPWVGGPQSRVWPGSDDLDSDSEEDEDEEDDEGRLIMGRADCCSYESITAAEGLTAWSFEELRVECYAQSLVARGSKPPPVVQPALAIPPAFVPRIVQRDLDPGTGTFVTPCKSL